MSWPDGYTGRCLIPSQALSSHLKGSKLFAVSCFSVACRPSCGFRAEGNLIFRRYVVVAGTACRQMVGATVPVTDYWPSVNALGLCRLLDSCRRPCVRHTFTSRFVALRPNAFTCHEGVGISHDLRNAIITFALPGSRWVLLTPGHQGGTAEFGKNRTLS